MYLYACIYSLIRFNEAAVFIGSPITAVHVAPDGTMAMTIAITLGVLFIAVNAVAANLFFNYREMAIVRRSKEQEILIMQLQQAQQQLLQSEKMASVGQLAAGIAHEINNPIGFVNSNIMLVLYLFYLTNIKNLSGNYR